MQDTDNDLLIGQYLLEQEGKELGYNRYMNNQKYYEENNMLSKKAASRLVIKDRVKIISEILEAYEKETLGIGGNYNKMLPLIKIKGKYDIAAFIGIQIALNHCFDETTTFSQLVLKIALELKKEHDIHEFEEENKKYYNLMLRDFKKKKITNIRKKEKIIREYYEKKFKEIEKWSLELRTHLGSKVLSAIAEACPDIFYVENVRRGKKTTKYLKATLDFNDWVELFEENKAFSLPVHLPMIVQPNDWTTTTNGGYLTYNNIVPFVKSKSLKQRQFIEANVPVKHMEAVNKLQKTGYRVNKRMLDIMNAVYENDLGIYIPTKSKIDTTIPFPNVEKKEKGSKYSKEELNAINEYREKKNAIMKTELKRKGRIISYLQLKRLAERMKDFNEMFFVYNCDFRGRIYCVTSDLSPQGSDLSKSLIEYSKGKKIGYIGIRELAINIANKYGLTKATREERFLWVLENEESIRLTTEDPIRHNQFWSMADKPYQFLAACFEWADCDYGKNPEAETRIPCGLDGSCNGLQHYSAMLRDEVGAKATNLYNSEYPNDIYAEVADLCNTKLEGLVTSNRFLKNWQTLKVSRKCAKRPVMTYVYGATKFSCKEYILEFLEDSKVYRDYTTKELNEMAIEGSELVYGSIEEIVSGASKAMNWLRSIPKLKGDCVSWLTPIGFPVYQPYVKGKTVNIRTSFGGDTIAIRVLDYDKETTQNLLLQKNGMAPNFVHSLDATHQVITIIDSDLDAYTMIHDDYGTYACDVPKLKDCIRKSFYKLYSNHKPLEELASQLDIQCNLEYGNYQLEEILESEYFFD